MESIVTLANVNKVYRLGKSSVSALRDVSLSVDRGAFVSVAGPSGSGKTTLLNLIGCVDTPTSGVVSVNGRNTESLTDRDLTNLRLHHIGFIFQSFNLISVLSVFQNVELPLLLRGEEAARARRKRVEALLEQVGLREHVQHRPNELSGGQRQRVAVARALVGGPSLVLADEPTANLDSATGLAIVDLMKQMNRSKGTTFIFSTHDPMVMSHASAVVRIADGRIMETQAESLVGPTAGEN